MEKTMIEDLMKKIIYVLFTILLICVVLFIFLGLIMDREDYKIDGSNITCKAGYWSRCGYDLEECSDGQNRRCVNNVIIMEDHSK